MASGPPGRAVPWLGRAQAGRGRTRGARRSRATLNIRLYRFERDFMSLHNVTPGARAPDEFNVIIEIPMNADPIKYEVDKESGAMFVDRFMSTAMHYPCNYGYVPQTLSDDGDPVDVLVITPFPLSASVVVTCRP